MGACESGQNAVNAMPVSGALRALAVMVVVSSLLSWGTMAIGGGRPETVDVSDPAMLTGLVMASAVGLASAIALAVRSVGWGALRWRPCSANDAVWAVSMVIPSLGIGYACTAVLTRLGLGSKPQMIVEGMLTTPSAAALAFGLAYSLVGASILEEGLFRGIIQPAFSIQFGPAAGIAVTAVLFGLVHLADPWAVIPIVAIGAIAGWLRHRSGGLGAPILFHSANNLVAFAFTVLAS